MKRHKATHEDKEQKIELSAKNCQRNFKNLNLLEHHFTSPKLVKKKQEYTNLDCDKT